MRLAMFTHGSYQREFVAFRVDFDTSLAIRGKARDRIDSEGVMVALNYQLVDGVVEGFPVRIAFEP